MCLVVHVYEKHVMCMLKTLPEIADYSIGHAMTFSKSEIESGQRIAEKS